MKVQDILTKSFEVIRPDASICEAALKMKDCDIGMLPVCDGERIVGAITDRDLSIRAVAEGRDPNTTKVSDVMTPGVSYCFEDQELGEAAKVMEEKQIRRLPVLNRSKRLVGIVSLGDFAIRSEEGRLTEEVLECVSEPTRR
jgi:CBS domain-containing protein